MQREKEGEREREKKNWFEGVTNKLIKKMIF